MDVAVLGPLRVRVGASWASIDGRRQRLVFGALLAQDGQVVPADRLVDIVWAGDPPPTGLQSLRYHVKKLRDLLTPGRADGDSGPIETVGSGYRLVVERDRVDACRFERLATAGARLVVDRRRDRAVEVFDRALGLWRGEAWQDFRYEAFAQPMTRRLDELRLVCTEDRIRARLGRGEHHDLVPELKELTDRYPLRERFWAQLMISLDRAGRRGEALEVHAMARTVLGTTLGVDPGPALRGVYDRIVASPTDATATVARTGSATPITVPRRRSSFVGRAAELDDLGRLLTRRRLVTVTGPGGVGKTSLAIEASERTAPTARVAFVDLATAPPGEDVASEIVRSLHARGLVGRTDLDDAASHIGDDDWLLLLDNCEHVTRSVAETVDELLRRCRTLTVLATSRRPLRVEGEHVLLLGSLSLPHTTDVAAVEQSDAVRLFVDRAETARGRFALTVENRRPVVEVCRRLDALPLAIELAAAQLRVVGVDELLTLLDRPLGVLVGGTSNDPRHRTLLATLRWSYDLLPDHARALLRRLSVFRGPVDLDTVITVCASDDLTGDAMLPALAELVDGSLVQRRDGHLALLDTVRAFADQQITGDSERNDLRERHAACFAERIGRDADFGSADQIAVAQQVRVDADNAAAALDWAIDADRPDLALPLLAGAAGYWYAAPHGNNHLVWLAERLDDVDLPTSPQLARALCTLGLSLPSMGLLRQARAVAEALERVATRLDDPEHHADALWVRAAIATVVGDVRASRDLFARGVDLLRTIGHPKLSQFLFDLAERELQLGDATSAASLTDELHTLATNAAQPLSEARAVLMRGRVAHHHGDVQVGIVEATRALARVRHLDLTGPQADPLVALCEMAITAEDWDLAVRSGRGLEQLLTSNGEIAALPVAQATLALATLAHGDENLATRRAADGLSLMLDTGAFFALDHVLLASIRMLTTLDQHDHAAELLAMRRTRRDLAATVDPLPVRWLLASDRVGRDRAEISGSRRAIGPSDELITAVALDRLSLTATTSGAVGASPTG